MEDMNIGGPLRFSMADKRDVEDGPFGDQWGEWGEAFGHDRYSLPFQLIASRLDELHSKGVDAFTATSEAKKALTVAVSMFRTATDPARMKGRLGKIFSDRRRGVLRPLPSRPGDKDTHFRVVDEFTILHEDVYPMLIPQIFGQRGRPLSVGSVMGQLQVANNITGEMIRRGVVGYLNVAIEISGLLVSVQEKKDRAFSETKNN